MLLYDQEWKLLALPATVWGLKLIVVTAGNKVKSVLILFVLLFLEFGSESQRSLLETNQGKKYREVFAGLRFQHIIIDLTSTNLLVKDRVIPKGLCLLSSFWFHFNL